MEKGRVGMKKFVWGIICLLTGAGIVFGCENEKLIAAHEKAVHLFDDWMRDPYIVITPDGDYYLTCTQFANQAEGEGFPMWKSKDLVHWEHQGIPYTLKDASNYEEYWERFNSRKKERPGWSHEGLKLWAPEIHFIGGRWVLMHTSNVGIGNFAMTQGEQFEGPFTDWGTSFGRQHDPSIFVDDDGSVWLVSKITEIQRIKPDLSGLMGEPIRLEPSDRRMGHEGSYILKIEGKYVIFGTAWSTDTMRHGTYNLYYTTSDKLTGPYDERKFVGRFLGHGTPFQDKAGRWWCTAFYNANKPTIDGAEAAKMDLSDTAYTINKQGLTLVPLEVRLDGDDLIIRAKDPHYRYPGAEEVQQFDLD
ncbi:MAG: family 43 glycosylhydrolase [Opitutales bacterium]|nr:family 43 glycosylhydrolase [Opitutales bacterium]